MLSSSHSAAGSLYRAQPVRSHGPVAPGRTSVGVAAASSLSSAPPGSSVGVVNRRSARVVLRD